MNIAPYGLERFTKSFGKESCCHAPACLLDLCLSFIPLHQGTSDAREGIVAIGFIGCDFANKCFIITSLLRLAAKKRRRAAKEGQAACLCSGFPFGFAFPISKTAFF